MATTYKHGAYAYIGDSQAQSAAQSGTIPVYTGTAPVNLVRGYADLGIVNNPARLGNWTQSQNHIGYSADWKTFTLCEAQNVHFNNPLGNCGPVYVINVLDPDIHRKAEKTTKVLTFTNSRAEFLTDTIILDTFSLPDKAEGADYTLSYNYTKGTVIVTLTDPDVTTLNASWYDIDTSLITEADIIGGATSDGDYSGIAAVALLYQQEFQVPSLLAAPGWSHIPAVYNALVAASRSINGHWIAFVNADLPLANIATKAAAINWKKTNGYNSDNSKVHWPMGQDAEGMIYHLSTLATWEFQYLDSRNDGVPGQTCSNNPVPIIRQYFGPDSRNRGFDQDGGNELNEHGITTIVPANGKWVLWGGHTAAYQFGVTADPREVFDTNVRMLNHCANSFQKEWGQRIDKPMTIQLRDEIINRENDKLAGYVAMGFMIGTPACIFLPSENKTKDLMNGDFQWSIIATPTPQFKSGTVSVAYTDAGLSVYADASNQ